MCALRLPEIASSLFERKWPEMPDRYKWLIYSIDSAPREANELYCAVRAAGIKDLGPSVSEAEWDESFSFLGPAKQNFTASDIQHILDHHFRVVEHLFTHANELSETDWSAYLFGFIVITDENWKQRGVTAVHCDKDRGQWKVTTCKHIPVDELEILDRVSEIDQDFDRVRNLFDGSGNDGPDNQGGPAPVGEWQFAVYCTGPPDSSTGMLQQSASKKIPDPCGDYSYPQSEACLHFLPVALPVESIYEDWPSTYAKHANQPIVTTARRAEICKLHPSLFVHVRGDYSGDLTGIEIVKMEWDYSIVRSEEELRAVGREGKTNTQKCEAQVLVATLEQLARET
jgi:hypothetical protein